MQSRAKVLVVFGELFSVRMFFFTGLMWKLREHFGEDLRVVFTPGTADAVRKWIPWDDELYIDEQSLNSSAKPSFISRAWQVIDTHLDNRFGFFPLALRFNVLNEFHLARMRRGHSNLFLNTDWLGPLPKSRLVYRLMRAWAFGRYRHVPTEVASLVSDASDVVLSNIQSPSLLRYAFAARRSGVRCIACVASWDHPVGKGVIYPHADRYIVHNQIMRRDLERYHDIRSDRVGSIGWLQTDVFAVRRGRAEYEALLERFGLDPTKGCILITGNTETNAPYEPAFVKRLVQWWRESGLDQKVNVIFRPHPKDKNWADRFAEVMGGQRVFVQPPSYTDLDVLSTLLQHADCVVTNAGTVLLDSLMHNRPVVCVTYDEGAPEGESYAGKNILGKHYEELMQSGAFVLAPDFGSVTAGILAELEQPERLAGRRSAVVSQIVGEIDGGVGRRLIAEIESSLADGVQWVN